MQSFGGPFPPESLLLLQDFVGNESCCDCSSVDTDWASVSHGTLLCLECAGKHRSLGVHVSFVRSIHMDSWSPLQVEMMKLGGNEQIKEFFRKMQIENSPIETLYRSKAAAHYRDKLKERAEQVMRGEFSAEKVIKAKKKKPTTDSSSKSGDTPPGSPTRGVKKKSKSKAAPVDPLEYIEVKFMDGPMGMTLTKGRNDCALVSRVVPAGSAEVLGLKVGDVVVGVAGKNVRNYDEVMHMIPYMSRPLQIRLERVKDTKKYVADSHMSPSPTNLPNCSSPAYRFMATSDPLALAGSVPTKCLPIPVSGPQHNTLPPPPPNPSLPSPSSLPMAMPTHTAGNDTQKTKARLRQRKTETAEPLTVTSRSADDSDDAKAVHGVVGMEEVVPKKLVMKSKKSKSSRKENRVISQQPVKEKEIAASEVLTASLEANSISPIVNVEEDISDKESKNNISVEQNEKSSVAENEEQSEAQSKEIATNGTCTVEDRNNDVEKDSEAETEAERESESVLAIEEEKNEEEVTSEREDLQLDQELSTQREQDKQLKEKEDKRIEAGGIDNEESESEGNVESDNEKVIVQTDDTDNRLEGECETEKERIEDVQDDDEEEEEEDEEEEEEEEDDDEEDEEEEETESEEEEEEEEEEEKVVEESPFRICTNNDLLEAGMIVMGYRDGEWKTVLVNRRHKNGTYKLTYRDATVESYVECARIAVSKDFYNPIAHVPPPPPIASPGTPSSSFDVSFSAKTEEHIGNSMKSKRLEETKDFVVNSTENLDEWIENDEPYEPETTAYATIDNDEEEQAKEEKESLSEPSTPTKETSGRDFKVVFTQPPLGMTLTKGYGGRAEVTKVTPDSAAVAQGVNVGDIIVGVNGMWMQGYDEVMGEVISKGYPVSLVVRRGLMEELFRRKAGVVTETKILAEKMLSGLGLRGRAKGILQSPTPTRTSNWKSSSVDDDSNRNKRDAPASMSTRNVLSSPSDRYEFDVSFYEHDLGMKMEERGGLVPVTVVVSVTSDGEAIMKGVTVGSTVIGLNGEKYISHAHTVSTLKHAKRPVLVRFRRADG